ncbi:MAG: hypothetical protein R3301_14345 [Saprospiraceae bacterium]|nr:hypothetical protein [Saprospiraceae bacterium]
MNVKHIFFFLCFSWVSTTFAQTKVWDGGAGTNAFGDAANWNPDGIPGVSDDLEIGFGNLVDLLAGNYTVRNIKISGYDAVFTIHEGATLTIANSTGTAFDAAGSSSQVINRGSLEITNSGFYGLLIYGVFTNDTTGVITITNAGDYGIVTGTNDTLYNHGNIIIDGSSNHSVYNTGTVTNYNTGTIQISNSASYGFRNGSNDFLNNYGNLVINGAVNFSLENSGIATNYSGGHISIIGGSEIGLNNRNKFWNQSGATIEILSPGDGFGDYGINNDLNDSVFNAGLIHVSQASDDGIYNNGYILNEASGVIVVDTSGVDHPGYGIYVRAGHPLTNAGSITINGASDHGLYNDATFSNLSGASMIILNVSGSGIFNGAADLLDNAGTLLVSSAEQYGLRNFGHVLNAANGTLTIQQSVLENLRNEFQDLIENYGTIHLHNAGTTGVWNTGAILLKTGGAILVD